MKTETELLDGLFIDPFRGEVRRVRVARNLDTWYKLLYCDSVECAVLANDPGDGAALDLWFEEEFLFREPRLPAFRLQTSKSAGNIQHTIHGYGLVLASDRNSESVGLSSSQASVEWFRTATGIAFERWQIRLIRPDFFIPQMIRTPELELPGRFKYIA
jgi:hypothetical protein